MPQYTVRMLAYGAPGETRTVDVPDAEVPPGTPDEDILERVFYYGQNDFQPKPHPSVSMGDVIELGDDFWMIRAIGFRRMTKMELVQYVATPRRDRLPA